MEAIRQGDTAEAMVHSFLAKSGQHSFVIQNFSTTRWKMMLGNDLNPTDVFAETLKKIANIEIDFLIVHVAAGIIAIECKAVKDFQPRRYTDSKKQLDKAEMLISSLCTLLEKTGTWNQITRVSVRKIISFPFVEMRQDVRNPHNLGKQDLEGLPQMWWDRLLEQHNTEVTEFHSGSFMENWQSFC